jgi:putative hydrolase
MDGDDNDAGSPGDPFAGIPFLGDLARALSSQGPLSWDAARQFAALSATEGKPEHNVDPSVRYALEELARIAELRVQETTGLDTTVAGQTPHIVPVTPGVWANRTLDDYRPLLTELATSLGKQPEPTPDDAIDSDPDADAAMAMLAQFGGLVQPIMLGMSVGSMVGRLAQRAFGQYDLPIPRPASNELLVVPVTVDRFAQEWSLPVDELRLWVIVQELTGHAVMCVPHIREALTDAVRRHAGGFRPDPAAVFERISEMDIDQGNPMTALQAAFGDPEVLLGAVRSAEQQALAPRLDALVAMVIGYVDHAVDRAVRGLLSSGNRIGEAVRRRRIEASPEDAFVEKLLGLQLNRAAVERGRAFVAGVIERAGEAGLEQLFTSESALPTPNELDAPGLWLARLDYA